MSDAGAGQDFVAEVDVEFTFFHDQCEEVEDVAGVEGARVCGALGGQVERGHEGYAAESLGKAGNSEFAVAAGGSGEVDEDRARAHGPYGLGANQARRGAAGDLGGGDDDVRVRGGAHDEIAAAVERLFAEFGGIASAAFRVDAAEVDVEKFCAEGAHLLSGSGAHVIGLNDGAEAAGGGD